MRPVLVVVVLVLGQGLAQVPLAVGQEVVEAFAPERADEPLGEGVRPWRAWRSLEYVYVRAGEHLVKFSAELAVPVPDQEREPVGSLAQFHQQVARLLCPPGAAWMSCDTEDMHAPRFDRHDEQHVQTFEERRIDVEKVQARMPEA